LFAVLLARAGITGPSAAIEGKGGLWDVVARFDWAAELNGAPARIARTHLKCFPVCYHGQSAIWAALGVRGKMALADIGAIRIDTYRTAVNMMGNDPTRWAPTTHETADHSLPFVIATALRDGAVDYASFAAERLHDAELLRIMQTVSVHEDAAYTADAPASFTSRVTLVAKDGREATNVVQYPKGHDKSPLTQAEVEGKFISLFKGYGSTRAARQVINTVARLAELPDLTEVFAKFKQKKRALNR
jgi:2-methylcitrate dehydratase